MSNLPELGTRQTPLSDDWPTETMTECAMCKEHFSDDVEMVSSVASDCIIYFCLECYGEPE